ARKWFEFEAPAWAQPLPLTLEDCLARSNMPGYSTVSREFLAGQYGLKLRGYEWHLDRAPRFERFCADMLNPPPSTPVRTHKKPGRQRKLVGRRQFFP